MESKIITVTVHRNRLLTKEKRSMHHHTYHYTGRNRITDLQWLLVCLIVSIITIITTLLLVKPYISDMKEAVKEEYEHSISNIKKDHEKEIEEIQERNKTTVDSLKHDNKLYLEYIDVLNQEIESLQSLVDQNNEESISDFEILRKYWFVFRDAPEDYISIDLLRFSDDMCKQWNVNPLWMWTIYWRESNFNPTKDNPTSSARGLGQCLESSARLYWNNILGREGSYNHEYAYDPYINVEITTAMIGNNIDSGMRNAVDIYAGGESGVAYNALINLAKSKWGITLNENNRYYE